MALFGKSEQSLREQATRDSVKSFASAASGQLAKRTVDLAVDSLNSYFNSDSNEEQESEEEAEEAQA